jgi:hypothetical protein
MKHMHAAAVGLILALSACQSYPARKEPMVFLLLGQSNMSGRGALNEIPAGALDSDPRIRVFGNDGVIKLAQEPLDRADGQIDLVSADQQAGVGLGLAFAKAILKSQPNSEIVLVPCAKGGSTIANWAPNYARTSLYGSCLERAKSAAQLGSLAGVLWYQGESDGASQDLAHAWQGAFIQLVERFRLDLESPRLPFLVVSLSDPPKQGPYSQRFPAWSIVQSAQNNLKIEATMIIPAAGLARNNDELHLSTAGQIKLGHTLAKHWLTGRFIEKHEAHSE